ncbi:MAG: orotidine-5'-phosphate decarboxylase [Elusimicrobiota bacterium]|jgi:orotidine-5'-phosphate decarboxylase|nr:orotidine-5'-phosphate decarboxylase [Elusimicrobiota bacterium]
MENIIDKMIKKSIEKNTVLIVGLDPNLQNFPKFLTESINNDYKDPKNLEKIENAIFNFNKIVIDATFEHSLGIKPQLAYYEIFGSYGIKALERTIDYAKTKDLFIINDGKRGDIGSTSKVYAEAFLGDTLISGDMVTVNPYLGEDSYNPFIEYANKFNKGLFILVKTSNHSSKDIQDLIIKDKNEPVYIDLAKKLSEISNVNKGEYGYSSIGAVIGATYPKIVKKLRTILKHNAFLVPGYGFQGAKAADLKVCFDKNGNGAFIVSARSIIFSYLEKKYNKNISTLTEKEMTEIIKEKAIFSKDELNLTRFN